MEEQDDVIPLEIKGSITAYPQSYVDKLNKKIEKANELLTRFVMASIYFNGKEADLVEEAEEYSQKICGYVRVELAQAFLAGLKAGRPQWHTPDARLTEEGDYLFCLRDGEETMYDIVGVSIDGNGYVSLDSHIWSITDVIAWCEIPTFDKE